MNKLDEDPTAEGSLFVFINTGRDRAKLLWRDSTGFCILYKRLEGRLFPVPEALDGTHRLKLDVGAPAALLEGVEEQPLRAPTTSEIARAARSIAQARMQR